MAMPKIASLWTISRISSSKIKFSTISLLCPNHVSSKCLLNQTWQLFGLIYRTSKAVVKPRLLLTGVSISVGSLQLLEMLTWTLRFHNVKIAGNGVIPYSHIESKKPNVSSVMGPTNLKIIMSLAGVVKLTQRWTSLALKWRKVNRVLIYSNVLTVEVTIKQTQTYTPFGDIDSTESGTRRSILRSMKISSNQFV